MKKINQVLKIISFLYLLFTSRVFADVNIISPSTQLSNVWANKQILLINATDGEEVYYSFSGEDPLDSGFVYDGPVLIDITGDVELKITSVDKNHQRKDFVVNYSVDENLNNVITDDSEIEFFSLLNDSVIFNMNCGNELLIPDSLNYSISCFSTDIKMEIGRNIFVSENSTLERYVSLTVKNNENVFWNYVVHIIPSVRGEYSLSEMPFEICEWSRIKLKDNKFIYSIDDGWWQRSGQELEVDRSVPHTIRWQSVDYDPLNPIHSYSIPVTPVLRSSILENGSLELSLEGDENYRITKSNDSQLYSTGAGLHKKIIVDAFKGENFSVLFPLEVYSENVYQGKLFAFVEVNRKQPDIPEIVVSDKSKICRNDVTFTINRGKESDTIKYFVSGPFPLSFEQLTHKQSFEPELKVSENSFIEYDGDVIKLTALYDQAVLYKVYAYAIDKWDNVSFLNTENIIIDKCNYFINPDIIVENPDGTFEKPFNDFSQFQNIVNENSWTKFYISGKNLLPDCALNLRQNFQIVGIDKAQIEFNEHSSFVINQASCALNNILIKNKEQISAKNSFLINVSGGTLQVTDSELSFAGNKNAVLLNCSNAVVDMINSGLSSVSNDYSCVISAHKSKININNCRLSSSATTSVNISVKNTKLSLKQSDCSINGTNTRIAELYSSTGEFIMNRFISKKNSSDVENDAIWKDSKSSVSESKNSTIGFKKK